MFRGVKRKTKRKLWVRGPTGRPVDRRSTGGRLQPAAAVDGGFTPARRMFVNPGLRLSAAVLLLSAAVCGSPIAVCGCLRQSCSCLQLSAAACGCVQQSCSCL
eukprot:3779942-Prymnesium_polylepis.2